MVNTQRESKIATDYKFGSINEQKEQVEIGQDTLNPR